MAAISKAGGVVRALRIREDDPQKLRVRICIHMAARLPVQEAAQIRGVDKISVNAHAKPKRRVDVATVALIAESVSRSKQAPTACRHEGLPSDLIQRSQSVSSIGGTQKGGCAGVARTRMMFPQ